MKFLQKFFPKRTPSHPHFSALEKSIHYHFKNLDYLTQAFTHRSVNPLPRQNYERLEYLGDVIIDLVVSEELMREFPEGDEGLMTQKRSALVQKSFLARMGNLLDLLAFLDIEASVDLSVDKIAGKQMSNVYEALLGAMYLDGGLAPCRKLILETIWRHRLEAWKITNFKGRLIEFCHSRQIGNPRFLITAVSGPDHERLFEVHVKIGNQTFPSGVGTDKKTAEQAAAQMALDILST